MEKQPASSNAWNWILAEAVGLIVLAAFVLVLASMPPVTVLVNHASPTGIAVRLNFHEWGLNIAKYLATLKTGTLGENYQGRSVSKLLVTPLTNSVLLVLAAMTLALLGGVLKGLWDFRSMRRSRLPLAPMLTSAVQGLPDFWLILMLQLVAIWLFQTYSWKPFRVGWADSEPLASSILPLITLSLIPSAYIARITSLAMSQVYGRDYIRTARAKGLHEPAVIFKHVLRNALVQVLDGLPGVITLVFSNLLIVEYMFGFPGITAFLLVAISPPPNFRGVPLGARIMMPTSDVPTLVAGGVSLGFLFAVLYIVASGLRRLLDPRLRERGRA
ncbi:MAG: ABC transporter permease subunit [Symbiobacteriia bacterium]